MLSYIFSLKLKWREEQKETLIAHLHTVIKCSETGRKGDSLTLRRNFSHTQWACTQTPDTDVYNFPSRLFQRG